MKITEQNILNILLNFQKIELYIFKFYIFSSFKLICFKAKGTVNVTLNLHLSNNVKISFSLLLCKTFWNYHFYRETTTKCNIFPVRNDIMDPWFDTRLKSTFKNLISHSFIKLNAFLFLLQGINIYIYRKDIKGFLESNFWIATAYKTMIIAKICRITRMDKT